MSDVVEQRPTKKGEALPQVLDPAHPAYGLETYSVRTAAAYLVCHPAQIYARAAKGELGYRRDGNRRLRFSQADLDAWRQARRVEARTTSARMVTRSSRPVAAPAAVLPLPAKRRFS